MNVAVKKLDASSTDLFIELIRVFENVFEMKNFVLPDFQYLEQLLKKESFFVFVALLDGKVVGGLTAYSLMQYYSKLPLVYIYDLAVLTQFQRQGIGKMLISGINNYCRQTGVAEVFVQADEADDYALDFYRATGAIAEKVVHFYYSLNAG